MKAKLISIFILVQVMFSTAMAAKSEPAKTLVSDREKVITQYLMDLKNADYKDIVQLFEKNGIVVSTSRGNVNAKDFFYAFLPEIETANTELHQSFSSNMDVNRYAARFHFTFTLKDGETGDGEYVDEFVFADHSNKLVAVYMFENLKFKNN